MSENLSVTGDKITQPVTYSSLFSYFRVHRQNLGDVSSSPGDRVIYGLTIADFILDNTHESGLPQQTGRSLVAPSLDNQRAKLHEKISQLAKYRLDYRQPYSHTVRPRLITEANNLVSKVPEIKVTQEVIIVLSDSGADEAAEVASDVLASLGALHCEDLERSLVILNLGQAALGNNISV